MEAGKSKICRVGWQAGDPEEPGFQFKSKGNLLENSLLLRKVTLFVLVRPSTDWVRPTHHIGDILLYPKATNFLIQNTHTETSSKMFDQISEHHLAPPS